MSFHRVLVLAGFAVFGTSLSLSAQQGSAVLVKAEAGVTVNGQLVAEGVAASALVDLAEVRTTDGRAVIALKRGGTLVLGPHTSVRVGANRIYNFNRVEILVGSAVLLSATSAPVVACGTDAKLSTGGIFRFDVLEPERVDGTARCRLRVYDGAASTPGASLVYVLRDGQQMIMNKRAGDMIPVNPLDIGILDDFDRWAREQGGSVDPSGSTGHRPVYLITLFAS